MASQQFDVTRNIRKAWTLSSSVYTDPDVHRNIVERVFRRSWQLVADTGRVRDAGAVNPVTFLESCIDEPLVLTRDMQGRLRCLSNVCTHRANLVVVEPGHVQALRCSYHGRRFALDGCYLSMPEFDTADDFPAKTDDLTAVALGTWEPLIFAALDPALPFDAWLGPVRERLAWMRLESLQFDASRSRDYELNANWALYCDNYLEGLHIPFVHSGLAKKLDYGSYRTELFEYANVQVGIASDAHDAFDLPTESADHGQRVAGYYFWLFPNLMLNFYPWGLSINVVTPLAVDRTRVSYLTWVSDPSKLGRGAGGALDKVELEDEAIVEAVQRGVRSRFYDRGRFSPTRENGVHHFHRLLASFLNDRSAGEVT